jgi:hypothetical protein
LLTWTEGSEDRDATARVFDASNGHEIFSLVHHRSSIHQGLFLNDQTVLTFCRGRDAAVHFWSPTDGHELRQLPLAMGVNSISISNDDRTLFGQDASGKCTQWDLATGDQIAMVDGGSGSSAQLAPAGNRTVTWVGAAADIYPLRMPLDASASHASEVLRRLQPLSPEDRRQAYIDDPQDTSAPGLTSRAAAIRGDELRWAAAPEPETSQEKSDKAQLSDMRLEIVVNERSEAFLFHDKPFPEKLKRIEIHRLAGSLELVFDNGRVRDFGMPVDDRLLRYFENADRILVVEMNEKTGEPVEGDYYPAVIY